ncbi:MAG: ABC transporter permease [Chloroflexota bacterium]|nr:ABC transporter permease [Chloroflexota bacterium]
MSNPVAVDEVAATRAWPATPTGAARPRGALQVSRLIRRNPIGALGALTVALVIAVAVLADVLAPYDPVSQIAPVLQPPGGAYTLGTDDFGRDILSRVIHGSRVSLYVGVISVGIALVSGSILGLVAGFFGGWVDTVIMRVMDVLFGLPAIVLAIAITSILGPSLNSVLIAIGIVYAPQFGRVARAPTLSLRQRDFVTAARATGAGDFWIVRRHILPNMTAPVIVQATVAFSTAILTEATLSYLGLGTQPPTPSWGTMLNAGKQVMLLAPWTSIFPGLAVALTVLGFNLLGDGLRDILDPRLRGQ